MTGGKKETDVDEEKCPRPHHLLLVGEKCPTCGFAPALPHCNELGCARFNTRHDGKHRRATRYD